MEHYRCRTCYKYYAHTCECGNKYQFAYKFVTDFTGTELLEKLFAAYNSENSELTARRLLREHGISGVALERYMNDFLDYGRDAALYLTPYHPINVFYAAIKCR